MIYFKPITHRSEWEWMRVRARPIRCEDSQGIVAVNEAGEIKACAVFDTFTLDACSVHLALDSALPIKYGFFAEIARHAYHACGRERMFGLVPENNEKALKLNKHIGFREVTRIPDALMNGVGYVVMRMDKDECRFLPEEFREAA